LEFNGKCCFGHLVGEQEASKMRVFGFQSSGWSFKEKTLLESNVTLEICQREPCLIAIINEFAEIINDVE